MSDNDRATPAPVRRSEQATRGKVLKRSLLSAGAFAFALTAWPALGHAQESGGETVAEAAADQCTRTGQRPRDGQRPGDGQRAGDGERTEGGKRARDRERQRDGERPQRGGARQH